MLNQNNTSFNSRPPTIRPPAYASLSAASRKEAPQATRPPAPRPPRSPASRPPNAHSMLNPKSQQTTTLMQLPRQLQSSHAKLGKKRGEPTLRHTTRKPSYVHAVRQLAHHAHPGLVGESPPPGGVPVTAACQAHALIQLVELRLQLVQPSATRGCVERKETVSSEARWPCRLKQRSPQSQASDLRPSTRGTWPQGPTSSSQVPRSDPADQDGWEHQL